MAAGGNPRFMPPEVVNAQAFGGFAADLWATGIILCGMLFGTEAPFVWASPQDRRFVEICVKGNVKEVAVHKWNSSVSDDALDLIQNMLRANPEERLTLEQCVQHPWLKGETVVPQFPTPIMRKREV
jgi:serine/threonine-protein kinase Chk2